MNKKICIKCNKEKQITEFYKPYFSHCLECTNNLKHKEKSKEPDISSFNYAIWFNQLSERKY